jgi:hypothetical protein
LESAQPRPRKRAGLAIQYVELTKTSVPPVEVAVSNPIADNQPVVYIADASRSVLTLTLVNQTNTTLMLKGAASVPADMNDAGTTAVVYLDFSNLLAPDKLAELSLSAGADFRTTFFSDSKLWGLCPDSDMAWPADGVLSITINKLLVWKAAGNAQLDVYYVNLDQPGRQFRELKLLVENPPGNKTQANIIANVEDPTILITPYQVPPIQNTIAVDLVNTQRTALTVGADTVFYLSLAYGTAPGYGALMAMGSPLPGLTVTQQGGDGWDISVDTTGKTPLWRLRPTGKVALGTGLASTAVFEIAGIAVPHDFVAGPTTVYLQWTNLPGYRDDHTQVILQKRMPKPSVELDAACYQSPKVDANGPRQWRRLLAGGSRTQGAVSGGLPLS